MVTSSAPPIYDYEALTAVASATAYLPLPIKPYEQLTAASLLVADNKPAPAPAPKPAYEPLPTEVDTREAKPSESK